MTTTRHHPSACLVAAVALASLTAAAGAQQPTRPDFADAVAHWSPVISPSGMIFYTGEVFEPWRGSMFIGGLSCHDLVRVELNEQGTEVAEREDLPLGSRIREVEQGPDGLIYVLVDKAAPGGALWRLEPLRP